LSSLASGNTLVIIILTTDMNDNLTKHILNKGSTHSVVKINDVLCYFGKRQSIVKLQLMKIYCACFYGSYVT